MAVWSAGDGELDLIGPATAFDDNASFERSLVSSRAWSASSPSGPLISSAGTPPFPVRVTADFCPSRITTLRSSGPEGGASSTSGTMSTSTFCLPYLATTAVVSATAASDSACDGDRGMKIVMRSSTGGRKSATVFGGASVPVKSIAASASCSGIASL